MDSETQIKLREGGNVHVSGQDRNVSAADNYNAGPGPRKVFATFLSEYPQMRHI